jgi:flagellar biosynthetic protein FliR
MNIPTVTPEQVGAFLFVFLRLGAMIAVIPIFGDRPVLLRVRAGLSLLVAFLVFPSVDPAPVRLAAENGVVLAVSMAAEVLVGVILGFAVRCVFAGIQYAGEIVGLQMGLSVASVIDPVTSSQESIVAEFQYLMALVIFLVADGHHALFLAVSESFRVIPLGAVHFPGTLVQVIFEWTRGVFVIAVKIGAPVMAVLIFTNVALGIVARTVPQINVFLMGFPLQIAAGLLFLGLSVPMFVAVAQKLYTHLNGELGVVLGLMAR